MSQNAQIFTLNFATLFQCAIIPFKSKSQTAAVNALLIKPGTTFISTASSSNYVTGKRIVPDDYRSALVSLSNEELAKRLTYIGIFEYDRMCSALLHLVKCARIPSGQRERLINIYENSEPIDFIKSTIRVAADCKEVELLSAADTEHLATFANLELTTATTMESATSNADRYPPSAHMFKDKYSHNWVKEYTSQDIDTEELKNRDFFGSTVVSSQQILNMPYDFPKLLCLLTPMVEGNPIDDFTVEEFMKCMSIDINSREVTKGNIECLRLIGQANGVIKFISKLNLSEISGIAFLMAGKVTNRDAKSIEDVIHTASKKTVHCIHAMWYDEEIPEIEVTLITHICREVDTEGVKIWE